MASQRRGNFEVETVPGCIVVRSTTGLILAVCDEFVRLVDQLTEESPMNEIAFVVLDVNQIRDVGQNFIRAAAQIQKKLKSMDKDFVVIHAGHDWQKFVGGQGIQISILQDMDEVYENIPAKYGITPPKKPEIKLDVHFVNPFIEGALNTLKVQCSVQAKAGKPYIKGHGPKIDIDIAGVIGLTSRGFSGTIAIAFPQKTFLAVMGNMLGEKYTEITKELEDGAGELMNIIFGQAKATLNKNNYAIEKAIPTVVRGRSITMSHLSPRPTIVLPFDTEAGPFHVEISVEGEGLWAK